jgi:argininosuccinate lyase
VRCWGGRFREATDPRAADYTRSLDVDRALALDDLTGSIAHARGLGRAGILADDEVTRLVEGLEALRRDLAAGQIEWDPSLEDVHLNLEGALAGRIGPLAGKLHTGRSRNDQVATDLRLWLRRTIDELDLSIVGLERALVDVAEREIETIMPGTTHLQPAQPVLVAHHLLAYVEMLERDRGRLADARRRANRSPLGAGAIAGAGYPIDRDAVARELGFEGITANSIDAVSDRDFVAEALAAFAIAMVHLSRLSEELTWWSSPRFGYVRVAESFSTGSSMMPNKRNPDPAELVRARAGRVIGDLTAVLTMLKGLPLGYQRDLQEDKEPLFDGAATLERSLAVMKGIVETLELRRDAFAGAIEEGHITATAMADELVRRGVAFRSAHEIVARLVGHADERSLHLTDLDASLVSDVLAASDDPTAKRLASDTTVANALSEAGTVRAALARADVVGGTAPHRVAEAVRSARARLEREG